MTDLNQFSCTGRLGANPESRYFPNGDPVTNFRVAISKRWKKDGERKERTLWLSVVVTNKGLCDIVGDYLKKGSRVALSGELQSRSYKKDGRDVWVTELILGPFNSTLTMLDGKKDGQSDYAPPDDGKPDSGPAGADLDDEIPF